MKTHSVRYLRSNASILVPFWRTISEVVKLPFAPPINRISPSGVLQLTCSDRSYKRSSVRVVQFPSTNFMQLLVVSFPTPPHAVKPDWEWMNLDSDIGGRSQMDEPFVWTTSADVSVPNPPVSSIAIIRIRIYLRTHI